MARGARRLKDETARVYLQRRGRSFDVTAVTRATGRLATGSFRERARRCRAEQTLYRN